MAAKKKVEKKLVLPVVIEKDPDGFFAYCPSLQGCYTQGDSYEEVLSNLEDAVRLHLEDRLANDEPLPGGTGITLTTVEVSL
jgi:predicted RNase H-like HicB family nuclease